ncbi:MAG: hypothetical protein LBH71_00410 [Oscillospiraceae bacterium]|jgi:hypothetical protein|nr:hypothetical protein [Oscillospiraceae bacterium]
MNKKIWTALFVLLFVFGLSACGKESPKPPEIAQSYESDVKITLKDIKMECHIVHKDYDNQEITITSPKELSNFKIIKSVQEYSMQYKDMNIKMDLSSFPNSSFISLISPSYVRLVQSDSVKIKREGKYWIYEGKINSENYIIKQNDKTALVEKIEVPGAGLKAEFLNIKKIANEG